MHNINVSLTKSRLRSIVVIFPDDHAQQPDVTATIGLYGPNNVKVGEYSVGSTDYSRRYNKESNLDLSMAIYDAIEILHSELEMQATAHAQSKFKELPPAAVEVAE
jgi:hypothetical protein